MITGRQVVEVILEEIRARGQGQKVGGGSERDLDLGGRPTGRARVKGQLGGYNAAKGGGVVGEVPRQDAVGGLQRRVRVDQVQEVLDERGNGGARGGVSDADGHFGAIGLGEAELEPIAYDGRVASEDAQVTGGSSVQERRPGGRQQRGQFCRRAEGGT